MSANLRPRRSDYQSLGYKHWGTNPDYAIVDDEMIAGRYYTKRLIGDLPDTARESTS